jgi:hypothetical protein
MDNFIITSEQWGSGFVIQEYKGRYSLVSARQYTDKQGERKTTLRFGMIEIGKDKEARLPVAVELGSTTQEAIEALLIAIKHLEGEEGQGAPYHSDVPDFGDDSVPF